MNKYIREDQSYLILKEQLIWRKKMKPKRCTLNICTGKYIKQKIKNDKIEGVDHTTINNGRRPNYNLQIPK